MNNSFISSFLSVPSFLFFAHILILVGIGDLEPNLLVLIKSVALEGVEGDGGLDGVLEIDKAEEVLSVGIGCFEDQPDTLETREGSKNVWVRKKLRATYLSVASFGIPSTYRLFVASEGR